MSEDNTAAPPADVRERMKARLADPEVKQALRDNHAAMKARAAPPAPADVAGLVAKLTNKHVFPPRPECCHEAAAALTAQAGEIEALKQDRTFYHRAANEELAARRAAEARIAELREALRCSREYVVDTNGVTDLPIVEAIDAALAKGGAP
jgi:hypothetical protein